MKTSKIVLTLMTVSFFYACGAKEEKKEENKEEAKEEVSKDTLLGVEITKEGAISPAEFLTAFQGKDSMEAKIAGTIDEVCQKKGCWMTMDLGNGQKMRISYDYKFLMPLNSAGLPIVIEGMAYVDTISVADQKHYLEDEAASQEEIDAITEPEINISFLAKGVILTNE